MIVLSNTNEQVLQPGQSMVFNTVIRHTGCAEAFRQNTGAVGLRSNGVYSIDFSANVTGTVAAAPVQLALTIGGSPLAETTMIYTPAVADAVGNVATATAVGGYCGISNTISVTNTGVNPVTISANPVLKVVRVA